MPAARNACQVIIARNTSVPHYALRLVEVQLLDLQGNPLLSSSLSFNMSSELATTNTAARCAVAWSACRSTRPTRKLWPLPPGKHCMQQHHAVA